MTSACPCDDAAPSLPDNPPGLPRISARRGDWTSIRRMLLIARADEIALADWRPGAAGDLGTMIAEWWATLGEVLAFYDDLIANEAFLGTATRRESAARLIALIGYRPRPALAATATLAALLKGTGPVTLPAGFAFESIPLPGRQPQLFELDRETTLQPDDHVSAQPPARLTSPDPGRLLIKGKARQIAVGDVLRLTTPANQHRLTITAIDPAEGSPERTWITYASVTTVGAPPAARCRLERATLALPLWTAVGSAIAGNALHLAAMTRAIRAGDSVIVIQPGKVPVVAAVASATDVIWYANATDPAHPETSPGAQGIAVPHAQLTLASSLFGGWTPAQMTVLAGWVPVGALVDQPPPVWTGTPGTLEAIPPATFAALFARPALVADATGLGVPIALTATAGAASAAATIDPDYAAGAALVSPLDVFTGLLPVTRGKTVQDEVLGTGDARIAGQTFTLRKDPVTYVRAGAGYAGTVAIRVAGVPWQEVPSFYGQPSDAAVFTLAEGEDGKTTVAFGDGVNGRRLPSGAAVAATYRFGAGAELPAAGKLTRIVASHPGLAKAFDPVGAGRGADAEPAASIRRYAPRSVLTFGRAVSVADVDAIAAAAATPARVRTVWAWDELRQRAAITVYVTGAPAILSVVKAALAAAVDPHRPVTVSPAVALPITLTLTLRIARGYQPEPIVAAAQAALIGEAGVFSADRLRIGQPLFVSAISAALIPIPGVVTIGATALTIGGILHAEPLLRPADYQWLDLAADHLAIGTETVDG